MFIPMGDTVTILRKTASGRDDYGNVTFTTTSTDVQGCVVVPRNSSELVQGQDMVIIGLTVYLPYGTDVLVTDQLSIAGVVYEVDGEPGSYRSPFTGTDGPVQIAVTRYTG